MGRNRFIFIAIFTFALLSFRCRNKVTITSSYIYSSSWSRGEYQGFKIAKITLLDSAKSVFKREFNRYDLKKHKIDSNFCYGVVSKDQTRIRKDKIFFDRPNNNLLWFKCSDGLDRKNEIGELNKNAWYIIMGLYGTEDFYVFIDHKREAHVYSLGPTNW